LCRSPREGEPTPFLRIRLVLVQHDQIVAFGDHREVAVHRSSVLQDSPGGQFVHPGAQPRPALALDQLLVGRTVTLLGTTQAPLSEERGTFVEQCEVVGALEPLGHLGTPERRGRCLAVLPGGAGRVVPARPPARLRLPPLRAPLAASVPLLALPSPLVSPRVARPR